MMGKKIRQSAILDRVISKTVKRTCFSLLALCGTFVFPLAASAHEVYVLNSSEISKDLLFPPINLFAVALSHEYQFLTAALLGTLLLACVFGISILHSFGRFADPFLIRIKPYAAHIAQITLGLALIASAYYGALFGTELPLAMLFGGYAQVAVVALYVSGCCVLFGVCPRFGSSIAIVLYICSMFAGEGIYMLSYLTYFGESLVILLFGGGYALLSSYKAVLSGTFQKIFMEIEKRKHFIMRICFSTSLMYAALYAKLIHGELAINTVILGAFLVEMSIGLFFLIGFEIRFTALVFLAFLTASLIFFGESVWPHIVLIGTAITMLVHGYDEFTVEKIWYKKGKREPVL